jgi:hypothetical protein
MRRFGFAVLPGAMAGLLASLLSTNTLYGFDFASYVWRGAGLYTQLWGMVLLPPAVAQGYTAIRRGRGVLGATLLLAATLLSHLICGAIAVISLVALVLASTSALPTSSSPTGMVVSGWRGRWLRLRRLALLLAMTALATVYFWLPYGLDQAYMNRSVWENALKYDSYGHLWVLGALARGELLDFDRFPALTLLAGLGLLRCYFNRREERYRLPAILALTWLCLYFGRPTWGGLLDLLPLSRDMHFHRLIAGFHLGAIYLVGLGLSWPFEWLQAHPKKLNYLPAFVAMAGLLLYPVYAERRTFLAQNSTWLMASRAALDAEGQDIATLLMTLKNLPPGRIYAGLPGGWGRDYAVGMIPMYALLTGAGLDTLGMPYHALSLNADIQLLFNENRPDHYNLFNVRYVIAPADRSLPGFARLIRKSGRHCLYEVTTSGYFDLAGTTLAYTGSKADFFPAASAWLNSSMLAAGEYPALYFTSAPPSAGPLAQADTLIPFFIAPPALPRGHLLGENIGSDSYQAKVEVERQSTLLLKVTYHPNWHAYIDGAEVEPQMVMPSFMGVKLAPGIHRVTLTYRPTLLKNILTLLDLLVLPLMALVWLMRRHMGLSKKPLAPFPGRPQVPPFCGGIGGWGKGR